ncbi:Thioredoxin [hydrothermal vent metagenome]|uniref:Thioredoxin n=1 Tax=hydrothermal vent metagenome TaxID=652676 RepID=A0A1W1CEG6_9ZZZZ
MQKRLNLIIVILIVLLLSVLGYYLYSTNKSNIQQPKEVQIKVENKETGLFPPIDAEFSFQTIDEVDFRLKASDKKIEIDGLKDKIVFLKIFGWDCQYCKKEMPELINLKKELGNTFEVIAIEAQLHSKEESKAYVNKYGINYNIVEGAVQTRFYSYLKAHYGWSGIIPLTIVLGKGGNILAFEEGAKSYTLSELMKASIAREK